MLPSVNGNFIGMVALLPGVISNVSTESFGSDAISANGLDSRNNNFMLDGANNNDDVIGQRAGSQARTPLEAVAEFQVVTNQYDAEFGRTTGRDHQRDHESPAATSFTASALDSGRTRA